MAGKIEPGQLCTVEPVDTALLAVGDIVLCKVNGREYLHLVKAIQGIDSRSATTAVGSTAGCRPGRSSGVACASRAEAGDNRATAVVDAHAR
jgi:hypothetical protein